MNKPIEISEQNIYQTHGGRLILVCPKCSCRDMRNEGNGYRCFKCGYFRVVPRLIGR